MYHKHMLLRDVMYIYMTLYIIILYALYFNFWVRRILRFSHNFWFLSLHVPYNHLHRHKDTVYTRLHGYAVMKTNTMLQAAFFLHNNYRYIPICIVTVMNN